MILASVGFQFTERLLLSIAAYQEGNTRIVLEHISLPDVPGLQWADPKPNSVLISTSLPEEEVREAIRLCKEKYCRFALVEEYPHTECTPELYFFAGTSPYKYQIGTGYRSAISFALMSRLPPHPYESDENFDLDEYAEEGAKLMKYMSKLTEEEWELLTVAPPRLLPYEKATQTTPEARLPAIALPSQPAGTPPSVADIHAARAAEVISTITWEGRTTNLVETARAYDHTGTDDR